MMPKHTFSRRRGRKGAIATAIAFALVVGGGSLIGLGLASQRQVPEGPSEVTHYAAASAGSGGTPEPLLRTVAPLPSSGEPRKASWARVLSQSKPVSMDIPSINVHSTIQHLGQADDGTLETPAPGPHYNEAAWYKYSPTPGSLGPAVLLGHVDSAAEGPSVFFRLGELRPGNRVSVTRADGSVARFIVDEVHRYAKDDFPTKRVYGDIDNAGLRILTCGGEFDEALGHYEDNIVVYATLADSRHERSRS